MKKRLIQILNLLFLSLFAVISLHAQEDPDPQRFLQEIELFRQWDAKNAVPERPVLFIGSSSIRMWKTAEAFPELPVVNRGFGGAHFTDLLFFLQDVVLKYPAPSAVVVYCGDNDAAAGKSAERIAADFQRLVHAVHAQFPNTPLIYLPIKPSPSRWALWPVMAEANRLIQSICSENILLYYADTATPMLATGEPPAEDLFLEDHLHLSEKGYTLWKQILEPLLLQVIGKAK